LRDFLIKIAMKTTQHIITLFAMVTFFIACEHNNFPSGPVEAGSSTDTIDCSQWDLPAGSITVAKAISIGKALGNNEVTPETYCIKGLVTGFGSKHESAISEYGNAYVYIQDNKLASTKFYGYQVMGMDGERLTSINQIKIGDFIVIRGKITNYNGTVETEGKGKAQLAFSTNRLAYGEDEPSDTIDTSNFPDFPEGTITVAKAREIGKALGSGGTSDQEYLIKGRVKKLNESKNETAIPKYGNIYVYIHDSETAVSDFYGYQIMGMNGNKITSADQVQVGDFIVIKSKITNYNGTIETVGQGKAQIVYSTNPKAYE